MPPTTLTPKEKKSFTLSSESVRFLEEQRIKRNAQSVSAALEEILLAVRKEEEREAIEAAVTKYYDSLTDEDVEEDRQWAEFAASVFPGEAE